jgi:DHA1 family inner membrane transport protein
MAILIASLVRRYGYRRLYYVGMLALSLGSAVMAVAPNVLAVLVAALLTSLASAIIVPVALAMAATELSADAGRRAMSYQIASIFVAVALGLPACVLLAQTLGWRVAFGLLALLPALLLPLIVRVVPIGARDVRVRFDLATSVANYRELLANRSLLAMYAFLVLYVVCAFSTGAYVAALLVSRGFGPGELGVTFAVIGVAFVVSSISAGETLGKVKGDLRLVIVGGALLFCLLRGSLYVVPLPLITMIALLGLASLVDGTVAVALRALVASYAVRDRALSMVVFAACESLGQALGGVIGGGVLAISGYPGIGVLVFVVCFLAIWLPITSRRLWQPALITPSG